MSKTDAAADAAVSILKLNQDVLTDLVKLYDKITGANALRNWETWGDQEPCADAAIFTGRTYFWQLGYPGNDKAGIYVGRAPWGYHLAMLWLDPGDSPDDKGRQFAEQFAKGVRNYFNEHGINSPKADAK